MSVTIEIDHEKRANFVTWEGRVSADDILQAMASLHGDASFDPSFDTLCDYTAVHELVMESEALDRLMHAMETQDARTGRTAMVMPNSRAQQNVGKIMSDALLSRGCDTHRMFDNHLEAKIWLGLEDVKLYARL